MEWESRSIRASDGADLAVWLAGPAESKPVLLVHGFSLDHTTWGLVAGLLVEAGFRVVAPDLRGHGGSMLGSAAPTVDRMVADLVEVLEGFDIASAHLVGHSLGAVTVLAARAEPRLADSVRTATSIAGTEQAVQNPVMKIGARLFSSPLGIWLLGRRRSGRLMISTWFGRNPTADDLDWIRELSAACEPATRLAIAAATNDLDLRPCFATVGAPTMVLCGGRDKATPPKISERIAAAIDGATMHVDEEAGHMVMIENPDFVADHLSTWFSRHP